MKRTTFTVVVLFLGLLGHTNSQNEPSVDDVLRQVGGAANIPELNNLDTSALPVEEAKNLFKEKCTRNGGPDAFEQVVDAQKEVEQCLKTLVNVTELQSEMDQHRTTGDLDLVFKKYCNKRSILSGCVSNFTDVLENCLDQRERENKKIVMNITNSLLEFTCFKEGDRIALFIAAGGPECFQMKQQAIQDCANRTLSGYVPKTTGAPGNSLAGLETLPSLNFDVKECTDISNLQTCVVNELELCADPTPANIVDSIFNFVMKVTPCESLLNAQSAAATGNGAARVSGAFTVVPVILFAIMSYSRQNYFLGLIA